MVENLGIPVPMLFVLASAAVVVLVAAVVTYEMDRYLDLSCLQITLVSILVTQLFLALVVAAILFALSCNLGTAGDWTDFAHAVAFFGIAWMASVLVTVPSVLLTLSLLDRA